MATERTRILVDAGLSRRETFERLNAIGVAPETLSAILITHEHSDHICGLQAISKKLNIPVYVSRLTAPTIPWPEDFVPKLETFAAGSGFPIGDIDVTSFTIPHDATDPVGFTFHSQGLKFAIATDLGYMPESVRVHLHDSNILLLESNHALEMLKVGPYPWAIKQRIMSRVGHLSNDVACAFVRENLGANTSTLILGHLSAHNNHPALVEQGAFEALNGRQLFTNLVVAEPDVPAGPFTL